MEGLPVYDGAFGWVKEEIDLTMWAGKTVTFEWRMISDNFVESDGFYVDDWMIGAINEVINTSQDAFNKLEIYPNPASDLIHISMPYDKIEKLWMVNTLGQRINPNFVKQNTLSVEDFSSGMYYIILQDIEGKMYSTKVFVKE